MYYSLTAGEIVRRVLDKERWRYFLRGFSKGFLSMRSCPSCGSPSATLMDRGWIFYTLQRCAECKLLYRFPSETETQMKEFYESSYEQSGLTTDLPTERELSRLLDVQFRGTEKDFSDALALFSALGIQPGHKLLDYGANWGYCSFQFQRAGYIVEAFEISRTRAAFGKNLGVEIVTDIGLTTGGFDIVFSSHVLEHTPDPRKALLQQLSLVRPGGFIVAVVPNGSDELRKADFGEYHSRWGRVHPFLLDNRFVEHALPAVPKYFVTRAGGPGKRQWDVTAWDRNSTQRGDLSLNELLIVVRKPTV